MNAMLLRAAAPLAPLTVGYAAGAQDAEPVKESETVETESGEQAKTDAKAKEERICRYIKLDMSSRRKTKVCRTVDEWNALNNQR